MEIGNPTESQKLFWEFLKKCSGDLEIPARSKVIDAICELSAKMYKLGWNDAADYINNAFQFPDEESARECASNFKDAVVLQ